MTLEIGFELGSFLAAPVRSSLFVVHRIKRLREILLIFKMGSFVHFFIHPDVSGFRFAQHTDFRRYD